MTDANQSNVDVNNLTVSQLLTVAQQAGADVTALNNLISQVQANPQLLNNMQIANEGQTDPNASQPAQQPAPAQPPAQ